MVQVPGQEPGAETEEEPVLDPETGLEVEAVEPEADEGEQDGWEEAIEAIRASGIDPKLAVKNVTQYTKSHQEIAEERRVIERQRAELAGVMEIQQAFNDDPNFQAHVLGYQPAAEGEDTTAQIAQRALETASSLKAELVIEKALTELRGRVSKAGHPDFVDDDLLAYATENQIGDLDAAYLSMNKDAIIEAEKKKVLDSEKERRANPVTRLPKGQQPGEAPTVEQMSTWTDKEWAAHRGK